MVGGSKQQFVFMVLFIYVAQSMQALEGKPGRTSCQQNNTPCGGIQIFVLPATRIKQSSNVESLMDNVSWHHVKLNNVHLQDSKSWLIQNFTSHKSSVIKSPSRPKGTSAVWVRGHSGPPFCRGIFHHQVTAKRDFSTNQNLRNLQFSSQSFQKVPKFSG